MSSAVLFESRAKAQEAIAAGLVRADGRLVRKASERIDAGAAIEAAAPYPWVSRGGVKLAAALDAFGFDPAGRVCLDIGASTGGFTACSARPAARGGRSPSMSARGQLHADVAARSARDRPAKRPTPAISTARDLPERAATHHL